MHREGSDRGGTDHRRTARTALWALVCLLPSTALSGELRVHAGPWRAWLDSPGGPLPFRMQWRQADGRDHVTIRNGPERIEVARVTWKGGTVTLHLDPYDSRIVATVEESGRRLTGRWERASRGDTMTRMPFHARAGDEARFPPLPAEASAKRGDVTGRWKVRFSKSDDPAVALFEQQRDGNVVGTFLTPTGDYRFLAGRLDADRLRLSAFDGAHAFLFHATLRPDGTLNGDFWSRDTWHETWTARRDPHARLPDAFTLTRWTGNASLADLRFRDLDGNFRSLDEPEFSGKARIIEVFGSWCPNCNDATRYLVELDRRYRDRGLRIIGLAFELSGDVEKDIARLKRYVAHHGIRYPVLLAGTADKDQASRALPLVDRIRAYPTTLFIDARGRVKAVHTGFSGPATGDAYARLRKTFESIIDDMLSSP